MVSGELASSTRQFMKYYRFQFGLYVHELLVRDAPWFLFLRFWLLFIHALAPNNLRGIFRFHHTSSMS